MGRSVQSSSPSSSLSSRHLMDVVLTLYRLRWLLPRVWPAPRGSCCGQDGDSQRRGRVRSPKALYTLHVSDPRPLRRTGMQADRCLHPQRHIACGYRLTVCACEPRLPPYARWERQFGKGYLFLPSLIGSFAFWLTRRKGPSPASRRLHMLRYIIDSLQKLAATRSIAIVVLTQCATKMQEGRGAVLIPAIGSNAWEQGVFTRLVLFRDWGMHRDEQAGLHFAGAQRINGKDRHRSADGTVAFRIETVSSCTLCSFTLGVQSRLNPPRNETF